MCGTHYIYFANNAEQNSHSVIGEAGKGNLSQCSNWFDQSQHKAVLFSSQYIWKNYGCVPRLTACDFGDVPPTMSGDSNQLSLQ